MDGEIVVSTVENLRNCLRGKTAVLSVYNGNGEASVEVSKRQAELWFLSCLQDAENYDSPVEVTCEFNGAFARLLVAKS